MNQTNPNLVGKNNHHFIISPNFLAQEIWQFGWVILLFHVALQRSLVIFGWQVDTFGGAMLVSLTHLVTWKRWGHGSTVTVSQSSYTLPLQHGDLRISGLLKWCLRIASVGVLVNETETAWPFMTWSQRQW